jgi:hypothetical protein
MLLLSQERIFRELKKTYAHQIARLGLDTETDKKKAYSILTFYNLSVLINAAVNDYEKSQDPSDAKLTKSAIIHLLSLVNGDILKEMDQIDSKYSDSVLYNALKLTQKTRGDKHE